MKSKLLITAAALSLLASHASAETAAVVVYGKLKQREREVIATTLTKSIEQASWSIVAAPLSQEEQDAIAACASLDRPWSCIASTARSKGFDRVAVVQVEPEKGTKNLMLVGQIIVEGNSVASTEQGTCKACSSDEALIAATSELADKMIEHAKARHPTATLAIRTTPPGAVVTLDGQMLAGQTDLTVNVSAGPHTLLIQRSGFRPVTRTIEAVSGKTTDVDVPLTAAEGGGTGRDRVDTAPSRSRLVPGMLIGIGGAALIGGTVYSLTRDPPDTRAQPKYLYDGVGIGVAVGGAAVVAAGLYLWFKHPSGGRSTATIAPVPGGGVAGWMTSF